MYVCSRPSAFVSIFQRAGQRGSARGGGGPAAGGALPAGDELRSSRSCNSMYATLMHASQQGKRPCKGKGHSKASVVCLGNQEANGDDANDATAGMME